MVGGRKEDGEDWRHEAAIQAGLSDRPITATINTRWPASSGPVEGLQLLEWALVLFSNRSRARRKEFVQSFAVVRATFDCCPGLSLDEITRAWKRHALIDTVAQCRARS